MNAPNTQAAQDAWWYDADAREIRDANGLPVARDVRPDDAARILRSRPGRAVWLVEGEHWDQPGRIVSAHTTAGAADAAALALVNTLRGDAALPPSHGPASTALAELKAELRRQHPGARYDLECDVWITPLDLDPPAQSAPPRADPDAQSAPARRVRVVCRACGSENVARDAWAEWDAEAQRWELASVFAAAVCHDCGDANATLDGAPLRPDGDA